ncbi:MAG: hypothetical protein WCI46_06270 [Verrucomicrobiota bacterium]
MNIQAPQVTPVKIAEIIKNSGRTTSPQPTRLANPTIAHVPINPINIQANQPGK